MEQEILAVKAGFRKGGALDIKLQLSLEYWSTPKNFRRWLVCFIDHSKAFDCVGHKKLWVVLNKKKKGMPQHFIILMCNLYFGQKATVKTEYEETEKFFISKHVRQGCILCLHLFNLYAEQII